MLTVTNTPMATCPVCGGPNQCQLARENPPQHCWCADEKIPAALLRSEAARRHRRQCICRQCIRAAGEH